jgi:hypothetical protein
LRENNTNSLVAICVLTQDLQSHAV